MISVVLGFVDVNQILHQLKIPNENLTNGNGLTMKRIGLVFWGFVYIM
jgi:hypothetical protein